jgi:HSP20 family molecular chaperone IbpA
MNSLQLEKLFDRFILNDPLSFETFTTSPNTILNGKGYHSELTDDTYHLEIPVPGLTKDSVTVKVVEGKLKIEGGIADHKWTPEFKKSFLLPTKADLKNIKASVENGILTIKIGVDKESETVVKVS